MNSRAKASEVETGMAGSQGAVRRNNRRAGLRVGQRQSERRDSRRDGTFDFNRRFLFMDFPSPFEWDGMFSPEIMPSNFSQYTEH